MSILSDRQITQRCDDSLPLKLTRHDGEVTYAYPGSRAHRYAQDMNYLMSCSSCSSAVPPYLIESLSESDSEYRKMFKRMISPFSPIQIRATEDGKKIISHGTSSMGYDVTLANKFKIFTNITSQTIDPLDMSDKIYHDHEGDFCIIPPNSYILGYTREYFHIPNDIMVVCVGKSTLARSAAICNVTPIEPGFEGNVVIEIANASNLPLKVHANMGIAQFLFFQADEEAQTPYGPDRKYQKQTGLTTARL